MDGTFVDCEADGYQGHGVELEVYRFDFESRYWMGPFYYWSDLYQTGSSSDGGSANDGGLTGGLTGGGLTGGGLTGSPFKARNQIIMHSICIHYFMTFLRKVYNIFKCGIPLSSLLLVRVL